VKENELPGLVFRPQGERYNTLYPCKRSCRVSVHCWCWISHEGAGVFHRIEGHLDGLHYQHILQNVSVPSVWIFHPDDIIYLQQDHFSNHYSRENQEWLSRQADLEHFDWHRCDTSPVPVSGQSTATRLLRLEHTPLTKDRHPCSRSDSNPQSQWLYTARPLGPAKYRTYA